MADSPVIAADRERKRLSDALYAEVMAAWEQAAHLWGPTDGRNAFPRAEQLRSRIEIGLAMRTLEVRNVQKAAAIDRQIARLREDLAAAETNAADVVRCLEWRAAQDDYERLLARYKAEYDSEKREAANGKK